MATQTRGPAPDRAAKPKGPAKQDRTSPVQFVSEVRDELRKVVWPTWPELYRYTLVVIFTVLFLGIFIGGIDYLVSAVFRATIYNNGVH